MIVLPAITVTSAQQRVPLPIHNPMQCAALVFFNESAFNIQVQAGTIQRTIPAWTADILVSDGTWSSFTIVPTLNLPNITQPNNILTVNMYELQDAIPPATSYPMPLPRVAQNYGQSQFLTAITNASVNVTLPPNTTALLIAVNTHATGVSVVGVTTGAVYLGLTTFTNQSVVVPVTPGADSVVTVTATGTGAVTQVIALTYPATTIPQITQLLLNGSILALGQQTMVNSLPVVIASDQSAIPVSQAAIANLAFAAGGGAGVASAATGGIVSAVGGKTVTLYGYTIQIASANVGYLEADLYDSAIGSRFGICASRLQTAAGPGAPASESIWIPGGIKAGLGLGLSWKNGSAVAADVTIGVFYTQL